MSSHSSLIMFTLILCISLEMVYPSGSGSGNQRHHWRSFGGGSSSDSGGGHKYNWYPYFRITPRPTPRPSRRPTQRPTNPTPEPTSPSPEPTNLSLPPILTPPPAGEPDIEIPPFSIPGAPSPVVTPAPAEEPGIEIPPFSIPGAPSPSSTSTTTPSPTTPTTSPPVPTRPPVTLTLPPLPTPQPTRPTTAPTPDMSSACPPTSVQSVRSLYCGGGGLWDFCKFCPDGFFLENIHHIQCCERRQDQSIGACCGTYFDISSPSRSFILECCGYESCKDTTVFIDCGDGDMATQQIKGIDCSGDRSCDGLLITIEESCSLEFIECAPGACRGCQYRVGYGEWDDCDEFGNQPLPTPKPTPSMENKEKYPENEGGRGRKDKDKDKDKDRSHKKKKGMSKSTTD